MTEKTNLFPNLIRFRETNRLKMAIAASIMLWCATPQQAAADTYEKHEIASVQQQKVCLLYTSAKDLLFAYRKKVICKRH